MKKTIAMILTVMMVFSMAACGQETDSTTTAPAETETLTEENTEETKEEELVESIEETKNEQEEAVEQEEGEEAVNQILVGAFEKPDTPEVNEEINDIVEKAFNKSEEAQYIPVALLGTQVVAGMNYRVLCGKTPIDPEAAPTYVIATIYKDLQGNAKILEILESKAEVISDNELTGSWIPAETMTVSEETAALVEKATSDLDGAAYTPIANLGTQVVAGTNHAILCEITPVVPEPKTGYGIVYIYEDLEGSAKITSVEDFSL